MVRKPLDELMAILDDIIDVSAKVPYARYRSKRKQTKEIIIHRIKLGDRWEDIIDFFTQDPEGVATVTLPGSYSSKLDKIQVWRRQGIPEKYAKKAYTPYHILIDRDGWVYSPLGLDRIGAHTAYYNSTSIAVAFVGDFRSTAQLNGWEKDAGMGGDHLSPHQERVGRKLLRDLLLRYPDLTIMTHDDANIKSGRRKAKGCPGDLATGEVAAMIRWAKTAVDNMNDPNRF